MKQYTEQEIKSMVTPEIIKKMVEMAEGFRYGSDIDGDFIHYFGYDYIIENIFEWDAFPLLIHRAVEGWNKKHSNKPVYTYSHHIEHIVNFKIKFKGIFSNYQPESLTNLELALLHCLVEVLNNEMEK